MDPNPGNPALIASVLSITAPNPTTDLSTHKKYFTYMLIIGVCLGGTPWLS